MAELDPHIQHHPAVIEEFNKRFSDTQLGSRTRSRASPAR